jgi:acyl-[acyl-carrier-protein]-phospholipid O-acyltransferase/long-chain-fatty-acid--[acyl-carrier-protein] ligase
MVPHGLIEECLNRCLNVNGHDDGELRAVVTAIPDERKGERLIVIHTRLERDLGDVLGGLGEAGLPNLWIPSADSFAEVDALPVLGSGKIDLKRVRDIAVERFCR